MKHFIPLYTLFTLVAFFVSAQSPELVVQVGHYRQINDIEYSPDGKYIATCSEDNTIKIWEIATGREMVTLFDHKKAVNEIAFSPDSKQLVSVSDDRKVIIWDVESKKSVKTIKEHKNKVLALDYSPTGEYFATAGKDKTVLLHNVKTGKVKEVYEFKSEVNKVKFMKNGEHLYTETDRLLSKNAFFTVPQGKMVTWVPGAGATAVSFDQENTKFLAGRVHFGQPSVNIIKDWRLIKDWRKNKDPLWKSLIPFNFQDTTKSFNILKAKGQENYDINNVDSDAEGAGGLISHLPVFFSKDGKDDIVAGNQFGDLLFWRFDDIKFFPRTVNPYAKLNQKMGNMYVTPYKVINAHKASIIDAVSSDDGKYIFTSAYNGEMKLWDVELERNIQTFTNGAALPINAIAFTSDNQYMMVSSNDNKRYIVDLVTMQIVDQFEYEYPIERFEYSVDKKYALVAYYNSSFFHLWDMKQKQSIRTFKGHLGEITSLAFSENQMEAVSTATEGKKITWSLETGEIVKNETTDFKSLILPSKQASLVNNKSKATLNVGNQHFELEHNNIITGLGFTPDERFAYTASTDGSVSLWNLETGENVVKIIITAVGEVIAVTDDFYFLASKEALNSIAFNYGDKMYPFEQFDLRFNRPDIVLERIGYADPRLIKAYKIARKKRMAQQGLVDQPATLDFNAPTLAVDLANMPRSTSERRFSFTIKGEDQVKELNAVTVKVNGVPVLNEKLSGQNINTTLSIDLAEGDNKIQVTLQNVEGVKSLTQTFNVSYLPTKAVEKKLYFVTVGVSDYLDSNFDLTYANKDANDLQALFGKSSELFSEIVPIKILDSQATLGNILALKERLSKTSIDDHVLFFFAGHGLLDSKLDYYMALHDIDFSNPAEKSLSFDQLQELLSDIPARNKLIMIDACHSGEVEKEAVEVSQGSNAVSQGKLTSRGYTQVRRKVGLNQLIGFNSLFKFMKSTFADLRENTGTIVISSAGGEEYALESAEWKNGVFTFFVQEGLASGKADLDNDGIVYSSELQKYLSDAVFEATDGKQRPTSRVQNLSYDMRVW